MNKRVVAINTYSFGSTGKVMQGIASKATEHGYNVNMFVAEGAKATNPNAPVSEINTHLGNRWATVLSKITGFDGCFAAFSTMKMLRKIDKISPDIVHLHNLHHAYVNLPILFHYLKKRNIPVVWTLHDCWSFTGHCPHFEYEKCDKWKTGCFDCPRYRQYPRSLVDNSRFMWKWKKGWFTGIENMRLVTPSQWLANLVEESFLNDYVVDVIPNGVDLNVFKPTVSDFRNQYSIAEDHKIVLGVASVWNHHKGLDAFLELAKRLPDDYRVVLVGTNEETDKLLPNNVISIHKTENQTILAQIYSAADVFVNPTREDTFPTVNLEALACGTPVITYNTGGSPECIDDTCGIVVAQGDIGIMESAIKKVCQEKAFESDGCRKKAEEYSADDQFEKYIGIYKLIDRH